MPSDKKSNIDKTAQEEKQAERAAKKAKEPPKPPGHDRSLSDLKRTLPQPAEWGHIAHALLNDSPRSAALLAVAHLDFLLEEQIKFRFKAGTEDQQDMLLKPGSPLSSTEAKSGLLYCLGVFGNVTRADITIICNIRNVFAHSPHIVTFEHQSIRNKCLQLKALDAYLRTGTSAIGPYMTVTDDPEDARAVFINTAMGIGYEIWMRWALGDADQRPTLDFRPPAIP